MHATLTAIRDGRVRATDGGGVLTQLEAPDPKAGETELKVEDSYIDDLRTAGYVDLRPTTNGSSYLVITQKGHGQIALLEKANPKA